MEQIKIFGVCFTNKWPDSKEMDELTKDVTDQVNFWIKTHSEIKRIIDLKMDVQSSATVGWVYITITVLVRYSV